MDKPRDSEYDYGSKMPDDYEDEIKEEHASKRRSKRMMTILIIVVAILIIAVIGLLVAVIVIATKNNTNSDTNPTPKPVDVYSDLHFVTFVDNTLQYDAKLITNQTTTDAETKAIKDALIAGNVAITQDPDIMDFEPTTTTSKTEYSLKDWAQFRERFAIFGKIGAVSNPTRVYAVIYTPQEVAASYFPNNFKTISVVSTDTSIRDALSKVFGSVTSEPSVTPKSEMCKLIDPIVVTTTTTLSTSSGATTQAKSTISTASATAGPTTTAGTTAVPTGSSSTSALPTTQGPTTTAHTTSHGPTPDLTTTTPAGQPTSGTTASTNVVTQSTSVAPQTTPTGSTAAATTSTHGPLITTTGTNAAGTTTTSAGGPTAPTISPTISALIPCSDEIDVVFLIDQSGSITDKFEIVKTYVKYLATAWEIGPTKANIALATFSDNIVYSWILSSPEGSTTRSAFNIAVDKLEVNPSRTDISSALNWTETLTTRNSATKAIIILSDGQQSPEYEANSRVVPAKQLRDDGFMILSVVIPDINGDKDVAEMEQISGTIENVYQIGSVDSLLIDFQDSYEIQDKTCYRPTMPTEPTHSGCYYVCNTTTAPTPTTTVTTGYCHIDLMFLIDHSESIHEVTQWPLIRNFVKNITENFDIGMDKTLVSVTRFANDADIQFCFDVYTQKADLLNAIETLPYAPPGATAIGRGLQMIEDDVIISSCGYRGMKGTLILITDGGNNLSPEPFPIAASLRNNHDITIYAVGITTPDLDVEALVNMTGDASRVFNGTYQDLDTFAQEISEDACSTTTTTTTQPTTTCSPGFIDLVYLVDESESITAENFKNQIKPFLISVTTKLANTHKIGIDGIRVAMAWFSSYLATAQGVEIHGECGVEFYLNQVTGIDDFDKRIKDAAYNLGATDTTCGFNIVRSDIYNLTNGEREGSTKLLIVITDGKPNLGNPKDPSPIAKEMRDDDGVIILTVGVTKEIDEDELINWTGGHEDQFFYSPDFNGLDDKLADAIINTIDDKTNICPTPPCRMEPFNIAYLVDESESVYEHFGAVQTFMKNITDNVTSLTEDQSQFAMVWFSQATKDHDAAGVEFDWTVGFDDTDQKITDAVIHLGATNVFAGMEKVRNIIFDSGNSLLNTAYGNVLLFISDGAPNLPNNGTYGTQIALESAKKIREQEGVTIISIGINNEELDRQFLEDVAGSTDRVFIAESYETLGKIIDELVNSLNPCHPTVPPIITTPAPYCPPGFDIIFVADSSQCATKTNFDCEKQFMEAVVDSYTVGEWENRFALITYDGEASQLFPLDYSDTNAGVKQAIRDAIYGGGKGQRIDLAFEYVLPNTALTTMNGEREAYPDIIITISVCGFDEQSAVKEYAGKLRDERTNLTIYSVGAGPNKPTDVDLFDITADSGNIFFYDDACMTTTNANDFISHLPTFCENHTTPTEPPATTTAACNPAYIDLVYLVDESESITHENFTNQIKPFLIAVTTKLAKTHVVGLDGIRVAMVWFSSFLSTEEGEEIHGECGVEFYLDQVAGLTDFDNRIENAIYNLGATDTTCGFKLVRSDIYNGARGERDGSTRLLVVVTDGRPNLGNPVDPSPIAKEMRDDDGVIILTVGVTKEIERQEMIDWTGGHEDQFFYSEDFNGLVALVSTISDKIDTLTNNICQPTTTAITTIPPTTTCNPAYIDLVYLVDESESITHENFTNQIKPFLTAVTTKLAKTHMVGLDGIRVAMVWFSSFLSTEEGEEIHGECGVEFYLDQVAGLTDFDNRIENAIYNLGATDTTCGFKLVRSDVYNGAHGERDGSTRLLVVVTDGRPNLGNPVDPSPIAKEMRDDDGVIILTVGVTKEIERQEMIDWTGGHEDQFFYSEDFNGLVALVSTISDKIDTLTNNICQPTTTAITTIPPTTTCNPAYIDLVYLVDESESITHENFTNQIKPFLTAVTTKLAKTHMVGLDGIRVAMVWFSSFLSTEQGEEIHGECGVEFYLDQVAGLADFDNRIENAIYNLGATDTTCGFKLVRSDIYNGARGERDGSTRLLVVVTDGRPNLGNPVDPSPIAKEMRDDDGVIILTVGVTKEIERQEMIDWTGGHEDQFFYSEDFNGLVALVSTISDKIDTLTNNICQPTTTAITTIPPTTTCNPAYIDLVYLVDESESITHENFTNQIKPFLTAVTTKLAKTHMVGLDGIRVAMVWFSSFLSTEQGEEIHGECGVEFYLDQVAGLADFDNRIENAIYNLGATDTTCGFKLVRSDIYNGARGERDGSTRLLVVVTDGRPNLGNPVDPSPIAKEMRDDDGVIILTVGVTKEIERQEMIDWTGGHEDQFFYSEDFNGLVALVSTISDKIDTLTNNICQPTTTAITTIPPTTTCNPAYIDLVYLVDESESITHENFTNQIKPFLTAVTTKLAKTHMVGLDGIRVAMVWFSSFLSTEQGEEIHGECGVEFYLDQVAGLTDFDDRIENAIYNLGATDTTCGFKLVRSDIYNGARGERDGSTRLLVVVTDGRPNLGNPVDPSPIAKEMRDDDGVIILTVGVTKEIERQEMIDWTGGHEDQFFYSEDFNGLVALVSTISDKIDTLTNNICQPTTTAITTIPPTTTCNPAYIDLVYLVDESESITHENFTNQIKPFLTAVTTKLAKTHMVGLDGIRVAMVWFSSYLSTEEGEEIHGECGVEFYLDQVAGLTDFDYRIENAIYNLGATDTTCGFKLVRSDVYNGAHGERDGSTRLLVVVTDGRPNLGNPVDPSPIAKEMRDDDGVIILTVGVTKEIERQEMIDWTGGHEDQFFYSEDFNGLVALVSTISDKIDTLTNNICQPTTTAITTIPPTTTCNPAYIDLVYLVDESESITHENFTNQIKPFLTAVTTKLAETHMVGLDGIRVAMVWFSSFLSTEQGEEIHGECGVEFYLDQVAGLTDFDDRIENAIYNLGATDTTCGFKLVRSDIYNGARGERDGSTRLLVVVTDGRPNLGNPVDPSPIAKEMRDDDGVIILTVGVTKEIERQEMIDWTGGHEDQFFYSEDFNGLVALVSTISDKIDTLTNNICQPTTTAITTIPPTTTCNPAYIDLVYLVDESESITHENFTNQIKPFLTAVTTKLAKTHMVGLDGIRVAMVWFSSFLSTEEGEEIHGECGVEFYLDQVSGLTDFDDRIENAIYNLGATDTTCGFKLVRSDIYNGARGERDGSTRLLVVVTDGRPNLGNPVDPSPIAKEMRDDDGVIILTVGVTKEIERQEMIDWTGGHEDQFFYSEDFNGLVALVSTISDKIDTLTNNICQPTTTAIITIPPTTTCNPAYIDLVYLVDESESITHENFTNQIKPFLTAVTTKLAKTHMVGLDGIRVAMVWFSSFLSTEEGEEIHGECGVEFYLDQVSGLTDFDDRIENAIYNLGATDTTCGFKLVRSDIYNGARGERDGSTRLLVVVTDGRPNLGNPVDPSPIAKEMRDDDGVIILTVGVTKEIERQEMIDWTGGHEDQFFYSEDFNGLVALVSTISDKIDTLTNNICQPTTTAIITIPPTTTCNPAYIDLVYLVDESESITHENFTNQIKPFLTAVTTKLAKTHMVGLDGIRVAMVWFSSFLSTEEGEEIHGECGVEFYLDQVTGLTDFDKKIENAIYNLGATDTTCGFKLVRSDIYNGARGERDGSTRLLVVVTDGRPNLGNPVDPSPIAKEMRDDDGVIILTVGVTKEIERQEMIDWTGGHEDQFFYSEDFNGLVALVSTISDKIDTLTNNICQPTTTAIITIPPTTTCNPAYIDLVYLVDESESITHENFTNQIKPFLTAVTTKLAKTHMVGLDGIRVAMVWFSSFLSTEEGEEIHGECGVEFYLDQVTGLTDFDKKIENAIYNLGATDTTCGFKLVRSDIYNGARGERDGSTRLLVVVTDGRPNLGNPVDPSPIAKEMRDDDGVIILTVGVTKEIERQEMIDWTGGHEDQFFYSEDFNGLVALVSTISDKIDTLTNNICQPTTTAIITIPPTTTCNPAYIDLVYLVDESESITHENFTNQIKPFLTAVTTKLAKTHMVGLDGIRVAMVWFSSFLSTEEGEEIHGECGVEFYLDQVTGLTDFDKKIENAIYNLGATDTTCGFKLVRSDIYNGARGERDGSTRLLVVVTDGRPNLGNPVDPSPIAKEMRDDDGVIILTVGVTKEIERQEMIDWTGGHEDQFFYSEDFNGLVALVSTISDKIDTLTNNICQPTTTAIITIPPTTTCNPAYIDLVYLVDESESITHENFTNQIKPFLTAVTTKLAKTHMVGLDGIRVAMVWFSSFLSTEEGEEIHGECGVEFYLDQVTGLTDFDKKIENAIYNLGATDTTCGFKLVRSDIYNGARGERDGSTRLLVVVTDGRPNLGNPVDPSPIAKELRDDDGVIILTVGVTKEIERQEMIDWTGGHEDQFFYSEDFNGLVALVSTISDKIDTLTNNICQPTTTAIITIPPTTTCNPAYIDLVYLVDESESITHENFTNQIKPFLTAVTTKLAKTHMVGLDGIRVAMVWFSSFLSTEEGEEIHGECGVEFYLDQVTGLTDFDKRIENAIYNLGATDTTCGFKLVRTDIYNGARGERDGSTRLLVVVTDGRPNLGNPVDPSPIAKEMRDDDGVIILTVGVTKEIERHEMIDWTGGHEDQFFYSEDFNGLVALVSTISDKIDTLTNNICQPTTTAITTIPPTATCNPAYIDLVYLVDESESITHENFTNQIKPFLTAVTTKLANTHMVGLDGIRVAMVWFSSFLSTEEGEEIHGECGVEFYLDQITGLTDFDKRIENAIYNLGATDTTCGFKLVRSDIYNGARGERNGSTRLLVVVTDGRPNLGNPVDPSPIAKEMRDDDGVIILTVGVTKEIERQEMIDWTGGHEDQFFYSEDFNGLVALVSTISDKIDTLTNNICQPTTTAIITIPPTTTCNPAYIDLVYLVDESESITHENFTNQIKPFLTAVTTKLAKTHMVGLDGIRVAMVWFSSFLSTEEGKEIHGECGVEFYLDQVTGLTDFDKRIENAIYNLGATDTTCGFKLVRTDIYNGARGERDGSTRLLVVVTDGRPNLGNPVDPSPIAKEMRDDDGVIILTVGVTKEIERQEMIDWTGGHEDQFFYSEDFNGLVALVSTISDKIDTLTNNICQSKATPIATIPKTTTCSPAYIDLVYLVDESESITSENFTNQIKPFLTAVTTNLAKTNMVGLDGIRVAMVWFSSYLSNPQGDEIHRACGVEFYLDQVTGLADFDKRIENAIYNLGATDTTCGFNLVRSDIYTGAHGERDGSTRLLVVVTDGRPNLGNPVDPSPIAKEMRDDDGVIILTVGVTKEIERQEMIDWTGGHEDQFFYSEDFNGLVALASTISDKIDTLTNNNCQPTSGATTTIATTTTSTIPQTTTCSAAYIDLVYLVDESESITSENFTNQIKPFLTSVTTKLANTHMVGLDGIRVAMVWFSSYLSNQQGDEIHRACGVEFYLDQVTGLADFDKRIENAIYNLGATDTTCGFNLVRSDVYNGARGERDGSTRLLVVVTDGRPNLGNPVDPSPIAKEMRDDDGVIILTVGVTKEIERQEMIDWTGGHEDQFFYSEDFNGLEKVASLIATKIDDLTHGICAPTGATTESTPTPTAPCENCGVDTAIIFELSDLLDATSCTDAKTAVKTLINSYDLAYDRVALIPYADYQFGSVCYSQLTTATELNDHIDKLDCGTRHGSNLEKALFQLLLDDNKICGRRSSCKNEIIFIPATNPTPDTTNTAKRMQALKDNNKVSLFALPVVQYATDGSALVAFFKLYAPASAVQEIPEYSGLEDAAKDFGANVLPHPTPCTTESSTLSTGSMSSAATTSPGETTSTVIPVTSSGTTTTSASGSSTSPGATTRVTTGPNTGSSTSAVISTSGTMSTTTGTIGSSTVSALTTVVESTSTAHTQTATTMASTSTPVASTTTPTITAPTTPTTTGSTAPTTTAATAPTTTAATAPTTTAATAPTTTAATAPTTTAATAPTTTAATAPTTTVATAPTTTAPTTPTVTAVTTPTTAPTTPTSTAPTTPTTTAPTTPTTTAATTPTTTAPTTPTSSAPTTLTTTAPTTPTTAAPTTTPTTTMTTMSTTTMTPENCVQVMFLVDRSNGNCADIRNFLRTVLASYMFPATRIALVSYYGPSGVNIPVCFAERSEKEVMDLIDDMFTDGKTEHYCFDWGTPNADSIINALQSFDRQCSLIEPPCYPDKPEMIYLANNMPTTDANYELSDIYALLKTPYYAKFGGFYGGAVMPAPEQNFTDFMTDFTGSPNNYATVKDSAESTDLANEVVAVVPIPTFPTPPCAGEFVEVVFIVDESESIGAENFETIKDFMNMTLTDSFSIINKTTVGVAMVWFSDDAGVQFDYTYDDSVYGKISGAEYNLGITNTAAGIESVGVNLNPTSTNNRIAILITDGHHNTGSDPSVAAKNLRDNHNYDIYAVGITHAIDYEELVNITGSANRVFTANTCNELKTTVLPFLPNVLNPTCHEAPPVTPVCTPSKYDLMFLIDESESMEHEFTTVKEFLKSVINEANFTIGSDSMDTQVSLSWFSTDAGTEFGLKEYLTHTDVMNAIDNAQYNLGITNIVAGLTEVNDKVIGSADNRMAINDVLIVVTDGKPNKGGDPGTMAATIRKSGVKIIAIGIGPDINYSDLVNLTGDDGLIFTIDSCTDLLTHVLHQIAANLNQCYRQKLPTCHTSTSDAEYRINCHPEPYATKASCESRGCLWDICHLEVESTPRCWMVPSNRYKSTPTSSGLMLEMEDPDLQFFSPPISKVKVDHGFLDTDGKFLRLKFTDPSSDRYEVPITDHIWPQGEPQGGVAGNSSFLYETESLSDGSFSIAVKRRSTGVALWDLSIGGFAFEDQFMQLATKLPSDNFYGMGENIHPNLKHDFGSFQTWPLFALDQGTNAATVTHFNHYGMHPFYICIEPDGNAHGVVLVNTNAQEYETIPGPGLIYRTIGGVFDFYFFAGPTAEEVIQQYWRFIGNPRIPAYWALGFQLCRYGYWTLDHLEAAYNRTIEAGIPLDVQYADIDYMDRYKDFTYNLVNFTRLPEFVDRLHTDTRKMVPIIDPGIDVTYGPFTRGKTADAFIKWTPGSDQTYIDRLNNLYPQTTGTDLMLGVVWPDHHTAFPNFMKPSTETWWESEFRLFHKTVPIDGVWIDMNEAANFDTNKEVPWYYNLPDHPNIPTLKCPTSKWDDPPYKTYSVYNFGPDARLSFKTLCMVGLVEINSTVSYKQYDVHSLFGWSEGIATVKAMENIRGERTQVVSRSTYLTSGQYHSHWLGDNKAQWADLKQSLIGVMEFNFFGIPHVGADICGFDGDSTPELCLRWMQMGAFYPFARNHNTRTAIDQDPAAFGEFVANGSRTAMELRYRLLPFLYTLFYKANKEGVMVARPIFFEFPKDPKSYSIDEQYMWGSELLIAPVLYEGADTVTPYLPNASWYLVREDGYGTKFTGPGSVIIPSPNNTMIPILLKGGSIIPTQEPGMTTVLSRKNPFGIIVALDEEQSAMGYMYSDSGVDINVGSNYRYNMFMINKNGNKWTLTVSKTAAGVYDDKKTLDTIEIFGLDAEPDESSLQINFGPVNGVTWMYNKEAKTLRIKGLNLISLSQSTMMTFEVKPPPKRNCYDLMTNYGVTQSGVNKVNPTGTSGSTLIDVYCDMEHAGGGWTVIQRRSDNITDFEKNWSEYENGFGNETGDFWLGNKNIAELTNNVDMQLYVNFSDCSGNDYFEHYNYFNIDASDDYRLNVSGGTGVANDALMFSSTLFNDQKLFTVTINSQNGMKFSTIDHDNDLFPGNCASSYGGGWWFSNCGGANLNGKYDTDCTVSQNGVTWYTADYTLKSYTNTVMMIRP